MNPSFPFKYPKLGPNIYFYVIIRVPKGKNYKKTFEVHNFWQWTDAYRYRNYLI